MIGYLAGQAIGAAINAALGAGLIQRVTINDLTGTGYHAVRYLCRQNRPYTIDRDGITIRRTAPR